MASQMIFCRARHKARYIAVEECNPNVNHPACQECDSPNISAEHQREMQKLIREAKRLKKTQSLLLDELRRTDDEQPDDDEEDTRDSDAYYDQDDVMCDAETFSEDMDEVDEEEV